MTLIRIPLETLLETLSDDVGASCPNCGELINCYEVQRETNTGSNESVVIDCDTCGAELKMTVTTITHYALEVETLPEYRAELPASAAPTSTEPDSEEVED